MQIAERGALSRAETVIRNIVKETAMKKVTLIIIIILALTANVFTKVYAKPSFGGNSCNSCHGTSGNPTPNDTEPPIVSDFSIASTSDSLVVPIIAFGVTNLFYGVAVEGTAYMITETPVAPDFIDLRWTSTPPTSFAFGAPGTQTLYAWAKDGVGNVSSTIVSAETIITVATPNESPVANAGNDQTVWVGDTVTLDGSGSSDGDGDLLSFSWSLTGRPDGSVTALSDPGAVSPSFVADLPGTYIVQLIVHDGTEDSAPDTVAISTENSAPVAEAGDPKTAQVGDTITLDGSGSSDADGDLLNFGWSIVSRPGGSTASLSGADTVSPSFVADLPGTYIAQLIVHDGTVDSDADTVAISSTENSPPVAEAGDPKTAQVGETVTLDGSGSSDADGDQLSFNWSIVSRPAGSTAVLYALETVTTSFVLDLSGTYIVQLIVNDGTVDSAPDTVAISTENSAPVADAGKKQRARVGNTVTLDGSGSSDADHDPLHFSWSIVSRPEGSAATLDSAGAGTPSFVADLAGTYVVQLIVNDGTVDSNPDSCTITARGGRNSNSGGKGRGKK
jgi:hypothetical protein